MRCVLKVVTKVSLSRNFEKQLIKTPYYIQEKAYAWILSVETIGLRETMKYRSLQTSPLRETA